jgi:hypothetical protein
VDAFAQTEGLPSTDNPDFQILDSAVGNNLIQVTFERPLITGDAHDRAIEVNGQSQFVLWAHGSGGNTYGSLNQHSDRGGVLVNFKLDTAEIISIPKPYKWAVHGVLMVGSLGIALPAGMAIAKFGRFLEKLWFPAHMVTQIAGVLAAIAGIAIGYDMTKSDPWRENTHASIGTSLLGMTIAQVFIAAIRPHKDDSWRAFWYWVHMSMAVGIFVLSMANIFIGFDIYGVETNLVTAFTAWMVVFIVMFSLGTLVQIVKADTDAQPKASTRPT